MQPQFFKVLRKLQSRSGRHILLQIRHFFASLAVGYCCGKFLFCMLPDSLHTTCLEWYVPIRGIGYVWMTKARNFRSLIIWKTWSIVLRVLLISYA
jgi:hypothetical protein